MNIEKEIVRLQLFLVILLLAGCQDRITNEKPAESLQDGKERPYIIVLGTIQDGGSPHIGCSKNCCRDLFKNPDPKRQVVSLGVVDPATNKTFLIEATPDISRQLNMLSGQNHSSAMPDGIFLTHAHIGHYTGLMYLGREALGADQIPVHAMPEMNAYLRENGPWNQLVALKNIELKEIKADVPINLTTDITITPFLVPHRDEFSETVGFRIDGPVASMLFIPDIDKWHKWEKDIRTEISQVDFALLDGSFYDESEISYRDISEIPHPFLIESMEYFRGLSRAEPNKIHFIHFNHTNPVITGEGESIELLEKEGYHVTQIHQIFKL